jgi:hypothetical protein
MAEQTTTCTATKDKQGTKRKLVESSAKFDGDATVISVSRRTDVPADKEKLARFLEGLRKGSITYEFPFLARNKNCDRTCTTPLDPRKVIAISWWSKDFRLLVEAWPQNVDILCKYRHHFSFTINGEDHSLLEPGLASTIQERLSQLAELAAICTSLGQDPNSSIMVHIDPIIVCEIPGSSPRMFNNLSHAGALADAMKALGLSRLHISFFQDSWTCVRSRMSRSKGHFIMKKLDAKERANLLDDLLIPHCSRNGIKLQTCTADDVVSFYAEAGTNLLSMGACVGARDISSIAGISGVIKNGSKKQRNKSSSSQRACTCYPHRDVGSQHTPCIHGCRYCFMNPAEYAW